MSDTDGTCEYVLDPDDPETWGGEEGDTCYVDEKVLNEDGVWKCPHDTHESEGTCIFHKNPEYVDKNEESEHFSRIICEGSGENHRNQFLGAKFSNLELPEKMSDMAVLYDELIFTHAIFEDVVDWSNLGVDNISLDFRGVSFHSGLEFNNIESIDELKLDGVSAADDVDFSFTKVNGVASFTQAVFNGAIYFRWSKFEDVVKFGNKNFKKDVHIREAEFSDVVMFPDSTFNQLADFSGSVFQSPARFGWVDFHGETKFVKCIFNDEANFKDLNLDNASFRLSDLTDAAFNNTKLKNVDFENALLSRATLFGADLRGAKLSGAVLGDIRTDNETRFLGHPSDDSNSSPHTLSAIRSQPTCVYDPSYEEHNEHADIDKAKSVYRALEELGRKHARPRLQARSFVRRQDLQKKDYWKDTTADGASLEQRLIAGARWSRARVARGTLLYGESPWRVIAWSLGIIFSFALLYPLGGWIKPTDGNPITYAQIASNPVEILNSVYYSTLTYTALGFGDLQPVGLGRLLTTLETGLGAVMLALLVFIFGRRAAR